MLFWWWNLIKLIKRKKIEKMQNEIIKKQYNEIKQNEINENTTTHNA